MTDEEIEAAVDAEMERWRGHFAATFTGLSAADVERTFEAMKAGVKRSILEALRGYEKWATADAEA